MPNINAKKKEKILAGFHKGRSIEEIKKDCKIKSDATWKNYMQVLQEDNTAWLQHLAREGFVLNFKRNLDSLSEEIERMKNLQKSLQKVYEKNQNKSNAYPMMQNALVISNLIAQHSNILNKTPMLAAFNKFIQENVVEGNSKKKLSNAKQTHLSFEP